VETKEEFRPLGLTELLREAPPFKPHIYYNPHLDLLISQSRDESIRIKGAAKGAVLDIGFTAYPSWWRRILQMDEVISLQVWGARNLCLQYRLTDRVVALQELVERVLVDRRAIWVWSSREKKRVFAYMRRYNFLIDWPALLTKS
jgi:hypothetical protein